MGSERTWEEVIETTIKPLEKDRRWLEVLDKKCELVIKTVENGYIVEVVNLSAQQEDLYVFQSFTELVSFLDQSLGFRGPVYLKGDVQL